jgi:hypothetical protein
LRSGTDSTALSKLSAEQRGNAEAVRLERATSLPKPKAVLLAKPKRKLSAAGRRAIIAAAKKRWALIKAGKAPSPLGRRAKRKAA